jgi:protein-tyrosine phosphatase
MDAAGWRWLTEKGISADVNMRIEHDDQEHGIAPEAYIWLPTPDDEAPSLDQLNSGADFIGRVLEEGRSVYVHCASGVGRAPTMAAAYLITTGQSLDQALVQIQKVRPFIKITPPQLEILEQYEREKNADS